MWIPPIKALSVPTIRMIARGTLFFTIAFFGTCRTSEAQDYTNPASSDKTVAVNTDLNATESPSSSQTTAPAAAQDVTSTGSTSTNTFKISGEARAAMGIDSGGNAIFRRANDDLNERNFRILSNNAFDQNINTYDPAIYSRLKVVMDASVLASVVSVHLNLTADPWSYTGKSSEQVVTSNFGDTAKVQYLWWGNTGYTVNQIVHSNLDGNSFNLPETKVTNNIVPAQTQAGNFTPNDQFHIPAMKLDYTFMPVREAWVDIKPTDQLKLRIFPMGYEDQALTTDDPLRLSNNREWWAESPWIDGWQPGNLNTNVGGGPTFLRGQWDKTLSFFTRDSDGLRLTALRGVSLDANPTDETSWKTTIASPKTLWQDYGDISTLAASSRLKQYIGNLFYVGTTADVHQGYNNGNKDAENYTGGVDTGIIPVKGVKVSGEWATSKSRYDETTSAFTTKFHGNAYYGSIEASTNPEDMINKDYYNYLPIEKTDNFFKTRFYFARMDDGFESSLSDYNGTSGDSFWGEHLTFYPSDYRYLPGVSPGLSQYDLAPFSIGNGINYGQKVISWRGDTDLLNGKLHGLLDFRRVTDNRDDNNIETVTRTGWTFDATDRLTTKLLFIWHDLPKTVAGFDPFLKVDNFANQPFLSTDPNGIPIKGGEDPDLKTGSLGARYALTDWAALNGVWEITNDITLGTNDFPQGDLNSSSFTTVIQNGKRFEVPVPFLFDQGSFDQPPYQYHNIFKSGLELTPTEKWHIYLDYTRNPNKFAGNIDDNMNHYGIETSYVPTPKIGFFARYTLSQGYDINRLVNNHSLENRDFNNFFFEARMILPKDVTMSIQYGVGPAYNVETQSTDPALAFYATTVLQTQHIIRIVFDKKF
jgi:hypothetical protein